VLSLVKGSTVFINYLGMSGFCSGRKPSADVSFSFSCNVCSILWKCVGCYLISARAHDVAAGKQHKSIAASDVLKALEIMEFGDLVEPLSAELQRA
jgi:hypothetical protein